MFLEFLDLLESYLHSVNGWPVNLFEEEAGLIFFSKDIRVHYLASSAHFLDAAALSSLELFLSDFRPPKSPFLTLLFFKSMVLFFEASKWFYGYFWEDISLFRV